MNQLHIPTPGMDANPVIEVGSHAVQVVVVPHHSLQGDYRTVEVVQQHNAQVAYTQESEPVPITHGGSLIWGHTFHGIALPIDASRQRFYEPSPPGYPRPEGRPVTPLQRVMIKRLFFKVVWTKLEADFPENPLVEISRLQQLGDGQHLITILDALVTSEYLYIITPFYERGSLLCQCPRASGVPDLRKEAKARFFFRQMLDNVEYLQRHDICHADVDPSNFVLTDENRVLLIDPAASFRIPEEGVVRLHTRQLRGKRPFWAPELENDRDRTCVAFKIDIWASVVSLFKLVTGRLPFQRASPLDFGFGVVSRAFSVSVHQQHVQIIHQLLHDVEHALADRIHLIQTVCAINAMSEKLRQLFSECFRPGQDAVISIAEIRRHAWMTTDELPPYPEQQ